MGASVSARERDGAPRTAGERRKHVGAPGSGKERDGAPRRARESVRVEHSKQKNIQKNIRKKAPDPSLEESSLRNAATFKSWGALNDFFNRCPFSPFLSLLNRFSFTRCLFFVFDGFSIRFNHFHEFPRRFNISATALCATA